LPLSQVERIGEAGEHVRQPDVRSLNQHGRERLQICRRAEDCCVGRARKARCTKGKLRVAGAHDVSNRPRLKALRSQRVSEPWTYSAHDSAHFDLRFRNFFLFAMKGSMAHLSRRLAWLLVASIFVCACSNDDDGSGNPGGPSNTTPPSGVVSVAGNWTGTSDFQQSGRFFPTRISATIRQSDRNVEGTILFTELSWSVGRPRSRDRCLAMRPSRSSLATSA